MHPGHPWRAWPCWPEGWGSLQRQPGLGAGLPGELGGEDRFRAPGKVSGAGGGDCQEQSPVAYPTPRPGHTLPQHLNSTGFLVDGSGRKRMYGNWFLVYPSAVMLGWCESPLREAV